MDVAIVTVGDELLSGKRINTNATWLCEQLDQRGTIVRRVTTVADTIEDIAWIVNEYRAEYDAVVVTGGIGPTHDDVTIDGVAAAVGRPVVQNDVVREWLLKEKGYRREDLIPGTTLLPAGANPIFNPVGVAPGAVIEDVYVLPGVPEEMKAMFERIASMFSGSRIFRESFRTELPESHLVDPLRETEDRFDVTVGSYPSESVEIVIEGTSEESVRSALDWLKNRLSE